MRTLRTHTYRLLKLCVKYSTYESYGIACRVHIIPSIGSVKLSALTAANVESWLSDLDTGPRARQNAFKVLKIALSYAVGLDLLDRSPIQRMTAPRAPRKEPHIFSLAEVRKLLAARRNTLVCVSLTWP
jgi:site-specific recombinase XerD